MRCRARCVSIFSILVLAGLAGGRAQAEQVGQAVRVSPDGSLQYETDARGNRLLDFSHAGYRGGGVPLPRVAGVVRVEPVSGDDGARIQAALDHVADLPPGENGFRGAVVLAPGEFEVEKSLYIRTGGIVLRGSGSLPGGTQLVATGTGRETLLRVLGETDRAGEGEGTAITDAYVPVGATRVSVARPEGFAGGDRVIVHRPSPPEWIRQVGMDTAPARTHYKWRAGTVDLEWDRTVVAVDGDQLVLDAPLTTALEAELGGGTVRHYDGPGRISDVGIEHLRMRSAFDPAHPADEEHAWMAIEIDAAENVWVDDVTALHFVSSVVDIGRGARAVTVSDCASLAPVSEQGGYRRHAFHSSGQQVLFLRCFSEYGRCDFTFGHQAAGPNVFLYCKTRQSSDMSGSIGSWASGLLFDNVHVDGGQLRLGNLEIRYGGTGWAAAHSVLWQSSASQVIVRSPPGALNYGIGVWGEFYGEGRWQQSNEFVSPGSLYVAQLRERMGGEAAEALEARAADPAADDELPLMETVVPDWKVRAPGRNLPPQGRMELVNGWLVGPDGLLTGGRTPTSWWRGNLLPARTGEHPPSLTRWLPGRYGEGATDDLESLALRMQERNEIQIRHHWGLWYDRRREDHQMIRRMTDDVWPPFFEQPFARSGIGTAWDGLSRYDLTRFNPWYFGRLRTFADIAADKGLVFVNEMYFQHNIIESGAHWVDFPWRPVNNINETVFPEPPPFTGDTVKIGNLFYAVDEPEPRAVHERYIRHSLDNLAGQPNVLHTTGDEYTGPLGFVEFWLDAVAAWIAEGNPDPLIALSATKDVQDSVLQHPRRSGLVDVVEIKYWFETDDGLYAPSGGEELAPRQHLRRWKGGRPGPHNVASMIREYRKAFPGKAVICSEIPGMDGWAMLAAGGSLPDLPSTLEAEIRGAVAALGPLDSPVEAGGRQWIIGRPGYQYFLYSLGTERVLLDLTAYPSIFTVHTVDLSTGRFLDSRPVGGGRVIDLSDPASERVAYWITAEDASES